MFQSLHLTVIKSALSRSPKKIILSRSLIDELAKSPRNGKDFEFYLVNTPVSNQTNHRTGTTYLGNSNIKYYGWYFGKSELEVPSSEVKIGVALFCCVSSFCLLIFINVLLPNGRSV